MLEPEGTVEIKFRQRDLSKTMQRLDPVCVGLKQQLSDKDLTVVEQERLETELKAREELLMPMYHQVAVEFADLHDRAGRMQEKGVISVSTSGAIYWIVFILCYRNHGDYVRTFILTRTIRGRRWCLELHSETGMLLDSGQNPVSRVGVSRQAFKMSAK